MSPQASILNPSHSWLLEAARGLTAPVKKTFLPVENAQGPLCPSACHSPDIVLLLFLCRSASGQSKQLSGAALQPAAAIQSWQAVSGSLGLPPARPMSSPGGHKEWGLTFSLALAQGLTPLSAGSDLPPPLFRRGPSCTCWVPKDWGSFLSSGEKEKRAVHIGWWAHVQI